MFPLKCFVFLVSLQLVLKAVFWSWSKGHHLTSSRSFKDFLSLPLRIWISFFGLPNKGKISRRLTTPWFCETPLAWKPRKNPHMVCRNLQNFQARISSRSLYPCWVDGWGNLWQSDSQSGIFEGTHVPSHVSQGELLEEPFSDGFGR